MAPTSITRSSKTAGAEYAPGYTVLEGLEHEAREGRKGLWASTAVGVAEEESLREPIEIKLKQRVIDVWGVASD